MITRITLLCIVLFAAATSSAQSIPYSALYDNTNFSRTIDVSKPVGAIDGSAGTSPGGAATYTIPIKCPPGTGGMIPNLSIVYNSQGGNGILGQGWSLSGLSGISRAGKDLYHDNKATPVTYTNEDAFVLDGTRLAPNGANGSSGTTYTTEAQSYSVTTSYGNIGGGPQYFNVVSKDGSIMQYGNSADSRTMSNDGTKVMMWLLNKIQDINGNYVEFIYDNTGMDFRISQIRYTGNIAAGLAPFNEVNFVYGVRDDKNTMYDNANTLESKYLLYQIQIKGEGDIFKTYQFGFGKNLGAISYLRFMEEFAADGTKLNDTRFKYGEAATTEVTELTDTDADLSMANGIIYSGDFNGDGYSDLLVVDRTADPAPGLNLPYDVSFKIKIKNPLSGSYTTTETVALSGGFQKIEKMDYLKNVHSLVQTDVNGDGIEDIILTKANNVSAGGTVSRVLESIKVYYLNASGHFGSIETLNAPPAYGTINPKYNYFYTGDFNGDGRTDYITVLSNTSGYNIFFSSPSIGVINKKVDVPGAVNPTYQESSIFFNADNVVVINMNGDAKADLMVTDASRTRFYTFNFTGTSVTMDLTNTFAYPTASHDIYYGDFNGDGKTDILTGPIPQSSSSANWNIGYSDGISFIQKPFVFDHVVQQRTPTAINGQKDEIMVGDFNGDGKSDIYNYYKNTLSSGQHRIHYSNGMGFENKTQTTSIANLGNYCPGDFNGDGKMDILKYHGILNAVFQYYRPFSKAHLLEKITDGFNRTTTFTYEALTKGAGDFYTKGSGETYPLSNGQYPSYVVTSMQAPDGIGGTGTTQYKYNNLRLHRAGRGLLGFEKVTTINETANVRTESIYGLDTTFYVPYLKTTKTFLNSTGAQLSQADQEMSFTRIGSGYCFEQKNTESTTRDFLYGVTTTTINTFDGFGNITNTSSTTTGGETITSSTNTTYMATGGSSNPNRPSVVTTTAQRGAATTVSTKNTYDYLPGGLTKQCITVAMGDVTTSARTDYEYDAYGNLTQKASHNFITSYVPSVAYEYDSKGRFVTSEQHNGVPEKKYFTTHKFWGTPLAVTGINGLTTTNTYDSWGKLRSSTVPTGVGTAYTINYTYGWAIGTNRLFYTLVEDPSAPDIKTIYDMAGRAVETSQETFGGAWTTALTAYDARGNVSSSTNNYLPAETPMTTTNTYDELNRIANSSSVFGNTGYSYSSGSGVATTTVTLPDGKIKSNTVDAMGKLLRSNSNSAAGIVSFAYDSRGNEVQTTLNQSGTGFSIPLITKEYDAMGQLKTMRDPDAGTTKYKYTVFGQLEQQTDPKAKTTRFEYDAAGRLTRKILDGYTTLYTYFGADKDYRLQSAVVTGPEGTVEDQYDYVQGGGMIRHAKITNGVLLEKQFTYDGYNRPLSTNYLNSSFRTRNYYDGNGFLLRVKTDFTPGGSGDKVLYETTAMNGNGQITAYKKTDGLTASVNYYNSMATGYYTAGVQDLVMDYNYANGNVLSRYDALSQTREDFTYDGMDRLTRAQAQQMGPYGSMYVPQDLTYDNIMSMSMGQIRTKSDVGTYSYVGFPRNGVTSVTDPAGRISHETQAVKYTLFDKTQLITENIGGVNYEESMVYDAGQSRAYSQQKQDGVISRRRWYMGDMEVQELPGTGAQVIHYIAGGAGLCGMVVEESGVFRYYGAYTDHLGSIVALTDVTGTVIAKQAYDAWGQERNPDTWGTDLTGMLPKPSWLYRGYTGHEMLPEYGLVNMNGRLYDPLNGRMLRPDNFVTYPDNSQSYNRFSYAMNNPMKFTDPDGNHPILIALAIGFVYGAIDGGIKSQQNGGSFLDGAVGGAAYGTMFAMASSTIGFGIGSLFAPVSGTVLGELGRAGAHGLASYAMSGGDKNAFLSGAVGSLAGTVGEGLGGFFKTDVGSTVFAAAAGGASSAISGGNFMKGALIATIAHLSNQLSHKDKNIIKVADAEKAVKHGIPYPSPSFINEGNETSYIMKEEGGVIVPVEPGEMYTGRIDGAANKTTGVYKVPDFGSVYSDKKGLIRPTGMMMGFYRFVNTIQSVDMGVRDSNWLLDRQNNNDNKWTNLFNSIR